MNLTTQKRLAAAILGCGVSRVRMKSEKDVGDALTREDIRQLIGRGLIWKIQKKGTSKASSKVAFRQKSRGRRRGPGSKRGKERPGKSEWMRQIRAQRKLLAGLRDAGALGTKDYRHLYLRSKGGMFRSKKHLLSYLKERDLLTSAGKGRTA